jgi:hypothetical protein
LCVAAVSLLAHTLANLAGILDVVDISKRSSGMRRDIASLVLVRLPGSTTRGISATSAMRCPRAATRGAIAEAASAEATANRR